MQIKSKALEVNLADYHVDVEIDARYSVLQTVMQQYYGLMESLNSFLEELSHPYKNWQFIIKEARNFSLNHFHLIKPHPQGHEAARLFFHIFFEAVDTVEHPETRVDAIDNILLFVQKIIRETDHLHFEAFKPVITETFQHIHNYNDTNFFLFLKSFYQIKRLAEAFVARHKNEHNNFSIINNLLKRYYDQTYTYWLHQADPYLWFQKEMLDFDSSARYALTIESLFGDISHARIHVQREHLRRICNELPSGSEKTTQQLLELPGYNEFVEAYQKMPQNIFNAASAIENPCRQCETSKSCVLAETFSPCKECQHCNQGKLLFLFHIMNISGLSAIHEETLRDINHTLTWLIAHEDHKNVRKLLQQTFSILSESTRQYPGTALSCVLNMGESVYKTDDSDLINYFIDSIIALGFQSPMIGGVGNDWQIQVNQTHLQNIRTWLEIIELKPQWSTRLLSALIINLSLCGVFIKDTDLFPRDITRLLNSGIEPVYNLVKQLTRLFPAFFNDIGAEGELREISTRIDELTHRRDILIHFLRKQSHVESSNRIIDFMEAVLYFWEHRDKTLLKPFVPPSIYTRIETLGSYIDGVHDVLVKLKTQAFSLPGDILTCNDEQLDAILGKIKEVPDLERERVHLAFRFYKLLHQKYNLDRIELDHHLMQFNPEDFPDLNLLKKALNESDLKKKINSLLDYLELLKTLILSSKTYEIQENIYKKRHFTVDIPSMYGSYHEVKFDALGLTFRIECLVNVLFEELVETIDLSLITKTTFFQIYNRLTLFIKALKLDGISSVEIEGQLELLAHSLEVRGFSYTQYLDIFKGFARAVKRIITDHFNNIHEQNLSIILSQIPLEEIQDRYLSRKNRLDPEKLAHRVSEVFFRERLSFSLGLTQLDLLLSRILNILYHQSDKLPNNKLRLLLNYDPGKAMTAIDEPMPKLRSTIHMGNKGLTLVKLKDFGWPVPPGFIITTEVFRCREIIDTYLPAEQNFKDQIADHIKRLENITAKSFGNPKNALLLSVRSGSTISQPGMMDTFLNVGMNDEIAAGMAAQTGNAWFAWDNYRRFLQLYGMAFGLERDDFDAVISGFKQSLGIPLKRHFTGEQMRDMALAYKEKIRDEGITFEERPFEQLVMTIKSVLASWHSAKAIAYRKIMGISDDWGTAVTIQRMIFGNASRLSGSGVFFTHSPKLSGDVLRLWGDFTIGNQGEDVASGLVQTLAISNVQNEIEQRDTNITLESHFPDIYTALKNLANQLIYKKGWGPQEMEFTFEGPAREDLYLLQSRDMAIRKRRKQITFDVALLTRKNFLGHGIGIGGGAMSGRIVFNLEEINCWRKKEPQIALILVRNDTVPDDILEISASDGLLTARGGLTSHAAVVAHRLGKTSVVGCGAMQVDEKQKSCRFADRLLQSGEYISIDGQTGSVYQGLLKTKEEA